MNLRLKIVITLLFGGVMPAVPQHPGLSTLEESILERFHRVEGVFAVAFGDVADPGVRLMINEREMFHAASTMKTPVMIEIYKQAAEGRFSMDDSIIVKNEFKSIVDGSPYSMHIDRDGGERLYNRIGGKASIRELVFDMITVSGNLATNILIDYIGAGNVRSTMWELGADSVRVLRGVEDMKAFDAGLNNETSAHGLFIVYLKLARKEIISAEASDEMAETLASQEFGDLIPAHLPREIRVAHKTGGITGVLHDSGIVYLPDGRSYVLVILSKKLSDMQAGRAAIADVSKLIYDFVTADN